MKSSFFRFLLSVVCVGGFSSSLFAADSIKEIQKLLKDRTSLDFKVVSNSKDSLKGASFVVVESPTGERLALLASQDGTYIVPISDGISNNNSNNSLKNAVENVNKYNKDMKDTKVLALFKKHSQSILKIPSSSNTKNTTYMILDTTCPYCLHEVSVIEEYLEKANLEILIVGILGQKAHDRAAGYYNELQGAKTREQKIALLKKVFRSDYAPKSLNNNVAKQMSEASLAAGVQGVPYIINK